MKKYIGEPITVQFLNPPPYEKTPSCPDSFIWDGSEYKIERSLSEWVDFARKGKYENNMRESHLIAAQSKGSFGVGRFFFEVATSDGHFYEIYYDRAPSKNNKLGSWVLYKEIDRPEE